MRMTGRPGAFPGRRCAGNGFFIYSAGGSIAACCGAAKDWRGGSNGIKMPRSACSRPCHRAVIMRRAIRILLITAAGFGIYWAFFLYPRSVPSSFFQQLDRHNDGEVSFAAWKRYPRHQSAWPTYEWDFRYMDCNRNGSFRTANRHRDRIRAADPGMHRASFARRPRSWPVPRLIRGPD